MGRTLVFFLIFLLAFSQDYFLNHVPQDAKFISYVNFKSLKNSDFYEKHGTDLHKRLNEEADEIYKEFIEKTGFDPTEDIHELFISGIIESHENSQFVVMVRGKFPEKKLLSFFKEKNKEKGNKVKLKETKLSGKKAYLISERKKKKKEELAIVLLDDESLMAGLKEDVEEFLTAKNTVKDNKEIMEIFDGLKYNKQVYTVVATDQLNPKDEIFIKVKSLVNYVTLCGDVDDELKIVAHVQAKNEQNARDIESMLKGFIAASRLAVSEERDLIDFMNEIEVERDEVNIQIKVEINDERIEKLKKFKDRFESKRQKI